MSCKRFHLPTCTTSSWCRVVPLRGVAKRLHMITWQEGCSREVSPQALSFEEDAAQSILSPLYCLNLSDVHSIRTAFPRFAIYFLAGFPELSSAYTTGYAEELSEPTWICRKVPTQAYAPTPTHIQPDFTLSKSKPYTGSFGRS